ncbi:MAG: hypothetical protein KAJ19_10475 [Gammaproteobacteria bacterium]|nr:hypothetical protein [Gammaproteobacteria bacterium]
MIVQPGTQKYEETQALILNAQDMWKAALRDNADGSKLINNAGTLRHEDHRKIMDQVTMIRRRALHGVQDLMTAGLESAQDLETQLVGVESLNEFQAAERAMNPVVNQNNDTTFADVYTPMPITHQSWKIPFRQLGKQYKRSLGLSESVRQVSESLEDMLFNGAADISVTVSGVASTIIGYTTAPNRETDTISDWTDITTNGAKIIEEALEMVALAFSAGAVSAPNSLIMYVANDIWSALQNDYSTAKGDRTFVERLEAITEIDKVKPAEKLTAGEVLMVEMNDRTVELAKASDIVTVPHERTSALSDQWFTTYAVMVPIIKSDRDTKTGIVHGST